MMGNTNEKMVEYVFAGDAKQNEQENYDVFKERLALTILN